MWQSLRHLLNLHKPETLTIYQVFGGMLIQ